MDGMASCKSIWESDSASSSEAEGNNSSANIIKQPQGSSQQVRLKKEKPSNVSSVQIPLKNDQEEPVELTRAVKNKIRNLARHSQVKVSFPQPGDQEQCITLSCKYLNSLSDIEMKISSLLNAKQVTSARSFGYFTHFLSICFTNAAMKRKFDEFKNIVTEKYATPGNKYNLDERLFQNPLKLHMTLNILVPLTDVTLEQKAKDTLDACSEMVKQVLPGNTKLKVDVKGLGYFGSSPEHAAVLFAKVEDKEELFQKLVDSFVDKFEREGLMEKRQKGEGVKCHITLLNKTFRDRKIEREEREREEKAYDKGQEGASASAGRGGWRGGRDKRRSKKPGGLFNVKTLMQDLQEFEFAKEVPIDWVHLSSAREIDDETGFYLSLHKLALS